MQKLLGYDFGMGATLLAMFTILKKKACGQLRSPEGAAVLLESWIESGFWKSKQLVLNLPLGGD